MPFYGYHKFGQAQVGELTVSDRLLLPDGTAARPALGFTTDDDTGMYLRVVGDWDLVAGGARDICGDTTGKTTTIGATDLCGGGGLTTCGGNLTVTSDIAAAGGFRYVAAGGTCGTVTNIGIGTLGGVSFGMFRAGSLMGVQFSTATGITNAGGSTTRLNLLRNGAAWVSTAFSGANLAAGVKRVETYAKDARQLAAGDIITYQLEVAVANLAGATGGVAVALEIEG
jgi:hypothetical protein